MAANPLRVSLPEGKVIIRQLIAFIRFYSASVFLTILTIISFYIYYRIYPGGNPDGFGNDLTKFVVVVNGFLLFYLFIQGLPNTQSINILDTIKDEDLKYYFGSTDSDKINVLKKRADNSVNIFGVFWRATIILLFVFYGIETFAILRSEYRETTYTLGSLFSSDPIVFEFFSDVFNILSNITLFGCFIVLGRPTYGSNPKNIKFKLPRLFYLYLAIGLLMIAADFVIEFDSHQKDMKIFTVLVIALMSGLTFAIFTSRLDSKFIRTSGVIILMFYTYSLVFFLFPLLQMHQENFGITIDKLVLLNPSDKQFEIDVNEIFASVITSIEVFIGFLYHFGYIFKVVLALVLFWLFKSNKILLYFVRMNQVQNEMKQKDNQIYREALDKLGIPSFRKNIIDPFINKHD